MKSSRGPDQTRRTFEQKKLKRWPKIENATGTITTANNHQHNSLTHPTIFFS